MNNTFQLVRAIRGPLMLIALGTLIAIHRFQGISISTTWPVLLILLGVLKLLERMVLRSGETPSEAGRQA